MRFEIEVGEIELNLAAAGHGDRPEALGVVTVWQRIVWETKLPVMPVSSPPQPAVFSPTHSGRFKRAGSGGEFLSELGSW